MHTHRIRIILTSSRDPNVRVRSFLNILTIILPNSFKLNRGKQSLEEIIKASARLKAIYLLLLTTCKGNPCKIFIYNLQLFALKYVFKISGISLPTDYGVSINQIKNNNSLCIVENGCSFLRDFIIDMGMFTLQERCDILLHLNRISQNSCELVFKRAIDNVKFFRVVLEQDAILSLNQYL